MTAAFLMSLSPTAAVAGAPDTVVTIAGTGFLPTSVAYARTYPSASPVALATTPVYNPPTSADPSSLMATIPAAMLTTDSEILLSVDVFSQPPLLSNKLEFLITSGSAGLVTVAGDGTYSASPSLGPFGVPAQATSLAQALFEATFPALVGQMTPAIQARIVDATTSPPTTTKGRVMASVVAQINATADAVVHYLAPFTAVTFLTEGSAAGTIAESALVSWPTPITIGAISFIPNMTVAASSSNYATLTVARRQAGGAPTTLATRTTASTGFTAFVPAAFALSSPIQVAPGDVWTFSLGKTGSGALVGGGSLQLFVQ